MQLDAIPSAGWEFDGWSGDVTGSVTPTTIVVDADRTVTATFTEDTTAPVISSVVVVASDTSSTVAWSTDEPADSQVTYGPTTAYENGTVSVAELVTDHSVSLAGLDPATTYHFMVASADAAGNVSQTADDTFTTAATPPPGGPTIDVWYGDHQTFGANGQSQRWVNVLGKVSDPDGITEVTYRLNGTAPVDRAGPAPSREPRRLQRGDRLRRTTCRQQRAAACGNRRHR